MFNIGGIGDWGVILGLVLVDVIGLCIDRVRLEVCYDLLGLGEGFWF